MKIERFNESYYTNDVSPKKITTEWFNSVSDDEINRFIIGFNDGQGDHAFYTYKDILLLLNDSDIEEDLNNMTRSQILDKFYLDLDLGGNNSDMIYFNGKEYQKVEWLD